MTLAKSFKNISHGTTIINNQIINEFQTFATR